jgi:hypothetical protein
LKPLGWAFNSHHPIIKKLQALITRDRAREAILQREAWDIIA